MRIGICIPCHAGHIGYLDCVLASIERQTVAPDVVSIAISECDQAPTYTSDKYEILITVTKEQKNAAENRNTAAAAIQDNVDILSFIDADDFCAPRRIEIIKNIFETQNPDIVLHNYYEWTTEEQQKHVNEILPLLDDGFDKILLTNNFTSTLSVPINFGSIHCGFNFQNAHASIKVQQFKKQKFPEEEIFHACEDSHFNYLHYKLGSKIIATPLQLSLYAINSEESAVIKALKDVANKK